MRTIPTHKKRNRLAAKANGCQQTLNAIMIHRVACLCDAPSADRPTGRPGARLQNMDDGGAVVRKSGSGTADYLYNIRFATGKNIHSLRCLDPGWRCRRGLNGIKKENNNKKNFIDIERNTGETYVGKIISDCCWLPFRKHLLEFPWIFNTINKCWLAWVSSVTQPDSQTSWKPKGWVRALKICLEDQRKNFSP